MTQYCEFRRVVLRGVGLVVMLAGCSSSTPSAPSASLSKSELAAIADCSAANTVQAANIPEFMAAMTHPWMYEPLSLDALNGVLGATRALDEADLATATNAALAVGFEVVGLKTDQQCYWMLQPTPDAALGQASLLYDPNWQRDLVIEAPHVPEDHGTADEAALLFEGLGAKALIVAGAHRCAVTESSGCRATNQCNNLGIPVESDPAHSIHNSVNAMHLAFRNTEAVTLQLHTNFHPEYNGDALISNGTRYAIAGTPADAFFAALIAPDIDARWCNDPVAPLPSSAFCGETNTQGLASNGAADTCLGKASSAGGAEQHHFIHLEQSNDRMTTVADWAPRIQAALADAIPTRSP